MKLPAKVYKNESYERRVELAVDHLSPAVLSVLYTLFRGQTIEEARGAQKNFETKPHVTHKPLKMNKKS